VEQLFNSAMRSGPARLAGSGDGATERHPLTAESPTGSSGSHDAADLLRNGKDETETSGLKNWLRTLLWDNVTLAEASGSLGDLGTFLPLTISLAQFNGLDLGTTLIATGLYNISSGLLFGLPMPVQPMKSIAAIAVSENPLTVPQITAAGMGVSAIVLFLGATRLISFFNALVPVYVIRGMQLGLGIKLAHKGISSVLYVDGAAGQYRGMAGLDGWLLGCAAVVFILLSTLPREAADAQQAESRPSADCEEAELDSTSDPGSQGLGPPAPMRAGCCRTSIPVALILVLLGLVLAVVQAPQALANLRLGPSIPQLVVPSLEDWKIGFLRGTIPQLPLTTLNSVVAVCHLSEELFPGSAARPTKVAVSVGLMNLAGGWVGTMPCCHGAGGLAAQVKFGASTGTAVVILGMVKVLVGLLFGDSLLALLQTFPSSLLGSLLIFSGTELAMSARKQGGQLEWTVMLLTAAAVIAAGTAVGFAAGLLLVTAVAVARVRWRFEPIDMWRRIQGRTHSCLAPAEQH